MVCLNKKFNSAFRNTIFSPPSSKNNGEPIVWLRTTFHFFPNYIFNFLFSTQPIQLKMWTKNVPEMEVKPNLLTGCSALVEMYTVFCYIGTVIACALVVLLNFDLAGEWLQITIPTHVYFAMKSLQTIFTFVPTTLEDKVISVYRCFHHVITVPSEIICNVKFVLNSAGQLIIAVVSSLGWVKCPNQLLEGSAMGFSFPVIFIICSVLNVLVNGWECFFLSDLEN